jgi:hypothetical protein
MVQRIEGDTVLVDLGRGTGVLFPSEQIRGEQYTIGQRVKVLVLHVEPGQRGPKITLSRSHPDIVRKLFELEVPEIYNGIVEIKAVAREAGSRSKIAVFSTQDGVDAEMWTLDLKWLGRAQFRSMRSCVRTTNTTSSDVTVSPYVLGECRNAWGAPVGSTCDWGFWSIDKCDLETASTNVFQFSRYLWAQSRMRELLTRVPVQGITSPQEASDWCWLAWQYVSALLWSTNVRFDNPNSQALYYDRDLANAGLLLTDLEVPAYDGPPTPAGGLSLALYGGTIPGEVASPRHGRTTAAVYQPRTGPATVSARALVNELNYIGYHRIAPTRQSDFSPGTGVLPFMTDDAALPMGMTLEQLRDVRSRAYAIFSASGDSDALRWSSTKAWNLRVLAPMTVPMA